MLPKIIAEEKDLLVLLKPAGLLMHGLPNRASEEPTVAEWLKDNYPETAKVGDDPAVRPGMVHRLDRDTSGVLIIARNAGSFAYLKDAFQKRSMRKTYLALVRGHLERERNIITKPIGIKSGTTQRSVRSSKMQKEASTEYRVLDRGIRSDEAELEARFKSSLLEVVPHTGRTHQIRVHLTAIGHPILGDKLYGPKLQPSFVTRLMLHAHSIEFTDADGKVRKYKAPADKDFMRVLDEAGIKKGLY